jgi:hypothetical protein
MSRIVLATPGVAKEQLGKNFTAVKSTQATTEELLDT